MHVIAITAEENGQDMTSVASVQQTVPQGIQVTQ